MTHIRQPREYTKSLPNPSEKQLQELEELVFVLNDMQLMRLDTYLAERYDMTINTICTEDLVPLEQRKMICLRAYRVVVQNEIKKRNAQDEVADEILQQIKEYFDLPRE